MRAPARLSAFSVLAIVLAGANAAEHHESRSEQAIRVKTEHDVATWLEAAKFYLIDRGAYPASLSELSEVLPHPPPLRDLWGRDYVYRFTREGGVEVGTLGEDGLEGGSGPNTEVDPESWTPR